MVLDRGWFRTVIPALVFLTVASATARSDVISDWNAKAEAIGIERRLLPPPFARSMATLHVAMFEAVNAVDRRYTPHKLSLSAEEGASKDAAAAVAARDVLAAAYPDQQITLDAALEAFLATVVDEGAKAKGIELGKKAAAGILALRANDGASAPESYRPYTKPGIYVPTMVPVSSTYGGTTPWAMESGSQFRPAAPPALDSDTWTNDVNEIRELGAGDSACGRPSRPPLAASGCSPARPAGTPSCGSSPQRRNSMWWTTPVCSHWPRWLLTTPSLQCSMQSMRTISGARSPLSAMRI